MTPTPVPTAAAEEFGNPWMANLTEIGTPDPVGWWPPAPGWYLLAGLLALIVLRLAWRRFRRWQSNAYRRDAVRELRTIAESGASGLSDLPELLKRVALVAYPRSDVAALSGDAWLHFLDRTLDTVEFSQGAGRLLPDLAYTSPALGDREVRALIDLSRTWITRHTTVTTPGTSAKVPENPPC
jgi:hypothetical protein